MHVFNPESRISRIPPGIYFDFDHTLGNADDIRDLMLKVVEEDLTRRGWVQPVYGVDAYRQTEGAAITSGNFTMENVSRDFAIQHGMNPDEVWGIHRDGFESINIAQTLFPGVLGILVELQEKGCPLGIWTQGDPWWQNRKLQSSGVLEFVAHDRIIVAQNKVALLDFIPSGSLIIDDSTENARAVRSLRNDLRVITVPQETGLKDYTAAKILDSWDI